MNNLFKADYQKIFPENLKKYKNLRTLAIEFENSFKENIVSNIDKLAIYKNLELQSDEVLSELAWQYAIDNWQENLPREVKINLIKNAYWAHAKKGTRVAVTENLKKLNYPIKVQEWYEYGGKPFTFKVFTTHISSNPSWIDDLMYIIDKYKNCRSIVDAIETEQHRIGKSLRVGHYRITEVERTAIRNNFETKHYKNLNNIRYRITEVERTR